MLLSRVKLLILLDFALFGMVACHDSDPKSFVVANSKSYEGSLFRQNCAICHGPEANGRTLDDGRVIPNIRDGEHKYKTGNEIYNHIANGGNGMVPFRDQLTEREINLLVNFVLNDLRK